MKKFQARQGDLLIEAVDSIPQKSKKQGNRILAYGEATGHCHVIAPVDLSDVDVLVDVDGTMYVEARKNTAVVHDEHGRVKLGKGNYKVTRQREYDAIAAGRERRVVD